jgi:hypothetical protein
VRLAFAIGSRGIIVRLGVWWGVCHVVRGDEVESIRPIDRGGGFFKGSCSLLLLLLLLLWRLPFAVFSAWTGMDMGPGKYG